MNPPPPKTSHERQIVVYPLLGGLPAVVVSLAVLWYGDYTPKVQWTLTLLIAGFWLGFAFALRERIVFPLRTVSNLISALREGDFSLRARGTRKDAFGEVMVEVNQMGEMMRRQRLGAMEASALLRKVMSEIDVAVFAFDDKQKLRLVNRAGEALLAQPAAKLLGRRASSLGLSDCLNGAAAGTLQRRFPGAAGRWGIRTSTFREGGRPHQLLVLSDLTRELREEELQAWQRLVRVLGHELNNSLAPIKSISASLTQLADRDLGSSDSRQDLRQGLEAIGSRAEALSRFTGAYARLARIPEPRSAAVRVADWVAKVAGLEQRVEVQVSAGADVTIQADGDQLEQLLINLVRNGVDAALETGGGVRVGWSLEADDVAVWVEDDGPGISSDANLFVPFFTTKPEGTGIGLVLCRKIAENHGGSLTLANREDGTGCVARLRLPVGNAARPTGLVTEGTT